MFKKLKDKLAEEVKSSPQRIQQFAQAAQAAVTSASSSISDITNNDLFSITDNDNPQNNAGKSQQLPAKQQTTFQDVSLTQSPAELVNYSHDMESPRQRKLSNSSFASDVSFRLPSYEVPSTYHLQSDMEVSASEADERGISGGQATLDRVTKEQLYSAYKRTQERYTKYRNQYGDLARHYKLLERENAKARSVLVETQDKALRRISELKEQCALEQSAKAHLEKALRIDIEEKAMKIEALNTKVNLLQNNENSNYDETKDSANDVQLISLASDSTPKPASEESSLPDTTSLNSKIEKMDQLLNKYKESLKSSKDKNSQITVELQILSNEIDSKNKQIQEFKVIEMQLNEASNKIKELTEVNEELQNKINAYDFSKIKELSTLEMDFQKATEEITELRSKIDVSSKREEEYAISLAENKLSIHKELESKEAEIKSLKDSLATCKQEVQSMKILLNDYKNRLSILEEEKAKLNKDCTELAITRGKIDEMTLQLQDLSKKCQSLDHIKTKADEEYKCLQLQLKQETAEKLAMIDRNVYLESRNTQLSDENIKKSAQISSLENEMQILSKNITDVSAKDESETIDLHKELNMWKEKCETLESEIQEEREELVKLQTEIEKLLINHETIQTQNVKYRTAIANITAENSKIQEAAQEYKTKISKIVGKLSQEASELRQLIRLTSKEAQTFIKSDKESLCSFGSEINHLVKNLVQSLENKIDVTSTQCSEITKDYEEIKAKLDESYIKNSEILADKMALEQKFNKRNNEFDSKEFALKDELLDKKNSYERALEDIKAAKTENAALHQRVIDVENENQTIQDSFIILESEKKELNVIISRLEEELSKLNKDIETVTRKHEEAVDFVKTLREENDELRKGEIMESEATKQTQYTLETEKTQHEATVEMLRQTGIAKDELTKKLQNVEIKNTQLIAQLNELNVLHQADTEKIIELEETVKKCDIEENKLKLIVNEKNDLFNEIKAVKNVYMKSHEELENLKFRYKTAKEDIIKLNNIIEYKSKDCESKYTQINELEKKCLVLSEENIKLNCEAANFTSDINKLESEIYEIKKSHNEMEYEKDRLNNIIEKLESKKADQVNVTLTKDTQTEQDSVPVPDANENETSALFENKWVLENKMSAMTNTASLNLKTNLQEDIIEQYTALKINYDALKDDNRRLQSDIDGLQSYLTKISKENSVLNDKLREVIATSEHSMDNVQLSSDITQLNNELHSGKEKINDLLRENSILIEENLELKDQLNSQNYSKPLEMVKSGNNYKEIENIKEKYNDLLQNTSEIKKQNRDLEQINKSVSNNVTQLQDKNEKLKLSNEKLERRLDEALVSLRHLHSLSENTELEYLRNILYEYLTGTGMHSVTLAKVLAAIVKFDDMQTQMVLQKEKERQGFLRQLGII